MKTIKGCKVLVTGATGLIGSAVVRELLKQDCNVVVVTRNRNKGYSKFGDSVEIIEGDIKDLELKDLQLDYIIHGAANTSSLAFVETPVDIINDNYEGTRNLLEIARINAVKGFIFLSSMEVYGHPEEEDFIYENHGTNLDTMSIRSSYPESKRICECLCASYVKQYGVPAKVIRLTQTFGKGVAYDDKRVFAEFARSVIDSNNIVLHTDGSTKRSYLYLDDAVSAIITVLLYGDSGSAYNAANEATYCSILEMAQLVARECADGRIGVIIDSGTNSSEGQFGYAPKLNMKLNTEKIQSLGWKPTIELKEMFDILIEDMRKQSVV